MDIQISQAYYKVLRSDALAPTTNFDYAPYLPKTDAPGDWLPEIPKAQLSKQGYYLSRNWNMWYEEGARVYLAEFRGEVLPDTAGAQEQICCQSMRLIKDVTDSVLKNLHAPSVESLGKFNTALGNIGSRNTGKCNTGSFNEGNLNTGDYNLGDFNTGNRNSGIDNVGDFNTGNCNVGDSNSGHYNCGDFNKGCRNSGDFNVGQGNSGSFNKGNRNSGKWNVGDCHCGFFNDSPESIYMFNKPANIAYSKIVLPKWLNKTPLADSFEKADLSDLKKTLELPNFDYEIFERITGISKADFARRLGAQ